MAFDAQPLSAAGCALKVTGSQFFEPTVRRASSLRLSLDLNVNIVFG